jgi:hypothetical protein
MIFRALFVASVAALAFACDIADFGTPIYSSHTAPASAPVISEPIPSTDKPATVSPTDSGPTISGGGKAGEGGKLKIPGGGKQDKASNKQMKMKEEEPEDATKLTKGKKGKMNSDSGK